MLFHPDSTFYFQCLWQYRHHQPRPVLHFQLVRPTVQCSDKCEVLAKVKQFHLRMQCGKSCEIPDSSPPPPLHHLILGQYSACFALDVVDGSQKLKAHLTRPGKADKWLYLERGVGAFYYTMFQRTLAALTVV